jgi:hypothetical protein
MLSEGEKCLELVLLDGSNYESWCISILNNIESFNPYLLSIADLTQSLSPNVEALILKEHGVPMDAHLL